MNLRTDIRVILDTASPAVRELVATIAPSRLQARVGPACADLMRRNYLTLPPNKMGGASTHFWQQAADAVRWVRDGDGITVITDKVGLRQRLLGGEIKPTGAISKVTGRPIKNIAIAANALSYGKLPGEFTHLKFVQFGRGQNAPKALVMVAETATQIAPKGGKRQGYRATASEIGQVVMFWLKTSVHQAPNPKVIPTDEQFMATIEKAIAPLAPEKN